MEKLNQADQAALLQMNPDACSLNRWSHQDWTDVHLKQIDKQTHRDVIATAWRNVAPRKLVSDSDEST